jgi:DNA transformation protein
MKNLGPVSAAWLHAAGIHSPANLRQTGAIEAWHRVRGTEAGAGANVILLYALEGALRDLHWAHLPPEVKRELKCAAR